MPISEHALLRAVSIVFVLFAAGCEPAPDLAPVAMSFAEGTAGAGATAPSAALTKSAFGQRIRHAVETSPNVAQSLTVVDVAPRQTGRRGRRLSAKSVIGPQRKIRAN